MDKEWAQKVQATLPVENQRFGQDPEVCGVLVPYPVREKFERIHGVDCDSKNIVEYVAEIKMLHFVDNQVTCYRWFCVVSYLSYFEGHSSLQCELEALGMAIPDTGTAVQA